MRVEVSDDRLDTPPQRPTLPKCNHLNLRINEKIESDMEYEQEEDEESYEEYDEIEDDEYAEDDNLPTPTVSSLNNKNLHSLPDTENMNKIPSFRLKQERLRRYTIRLLEVKEANVEAQIDGGSNANIITDKRYFNLLTSTKGKIIQVTGSSGDYEGVGIVICQIGDDPVTIPLYPSYLMRDNPQNSISTTAIKKYNDFRSVRVEVLEWFKATNNEGKSSRVPAIRKRVESETLDCIKIDIMETTTQIHDQDFISAAPKRNRTEYKSELLIPPTINHAFCKNEALDNTIVHRRLAHALNEKVDKMAKLSIILDLSKRKSKRYNNEKCRCVI